MADAGATVSTIVSTVVVLIFGEITPKSLAKEMPEKFAMFSAPFLRVLMVVLTPFSFVFSALKNLMGKVIRNTEDRRMTQEELLMLVIGAAVIAVGADFLVEHGQIIAIGLGVPETVVALLFVALGTSLPELVTTITSLKKGRASLGVGNVIGANVFNLVLVSGVAVSLAPFEVPCENFLLDTGLNMSLVFEIPVMVGVMVLMTVPALVFKKLGRWQGIALLGIYAAFVVCQFVL